MSQFLIVYKKSSGEVIDATEYSDSDFSIALMKRSHLERDYGATGDVEVVVLGARDKDDLVKTHSRYFKSLSELALS